MNIIGNAIDALEEAMETEQWGNGEQAPIPSCPSPTLRICTEVKYEQDVLMQADFCCFLMILFGILLIL